MVKITGPTNPNLKRLIRALKTASNKEGVDIWDKVAAELEKPTRVRREVDIARLNRVTNAKEVVVVPGKVLATGDIDHEITVAAWNFSEAAKKKVKAITIEELLKQNPKGKNVKVVC
ncbi:50S ribosomal protein L18e [Candidatus Woesearchaeota archaeon]|nr:50S ribosomal protein L18e [Candidatus Woesearchaeota archaeon]